jgi:hypothetical protein
MERDIHCILCGKKMAVVGRTNLPGAVTLVLKCEDCRWCVEVRFEIYDGRSIDEVEPNILGSWQSSH